MKLALLIGSSALVTALLTYPISRHPFDHVFWILDSRFLAYVQAWDVHSITHPSRLFDANIFFPACNTLAFSENLIGNLPIFAPLYLATKNAIFAYNVVDLATFFLSAITMFWLVRYLTRSSWAAAVAGFVYAFVPARIFQMERVHIISEQWTPLVIFFVYIYLELGNWRALAAGAGFLYLEILSSLHGGMFTCLIGLIYVSVFLVIYRGKIRWRQLVAILVTLFVVGIMLLPVAVHYLQPQKQGALSDYSDPIAYSATPTSYLNGGTNHFYHGLLLRFSADVANHEKHLFFGLIPWILGSIAVAAYVFHIRRFQTQTARTEWAEIQPRIHATAIASAITVVAGFVLSLGPYLLWNHHLTNFSLPYLWLSRIVPGFGVMRSPARFAFMALFGLAVLSGLGTDILLNAIRRHSTVHFHARATAITAGLLWILFWEFNQTPLQVSVLNPPLQHHGEYAWLAAQPPNSPTLELPTSSGDWSLRTSDQVLQEIEYVYASTYHWQPLVNGFSGHIPYIADETSGWAAKLPSPEAIQFFRQIGLRFLVLHTNQLSPADLAIWRALPRDSGLREVAVIDDAIIYRLEPLPGNLTTGLTQGYDH